MKITRWRCYLLEPQPLLVFIEQPAVFLALKRVPSPGDHFRWNGERWRVRDILLPDRDDFGRFNEIEAVSGPLQVFQECPGCGGFISCVSSCWVGLHREVQASAPRPILTTPKAKKPRPGTLDAPLRAIVDRKGNVEELECGHFVHFKFFKFVDKSATSRRCLECCQACEGVERTVKRPRIF